MVLTLKIGGNVAEDDLGVRRLLRLEDVAEPVDALIGHLDGAEVHLAAEPGGHVEAGQRIEDRGLSGPRKTDKPDFDGAPRSLRRSRTSIGAVGRGVKRSALQPGTNDRLVSPRIEQPARYLPRRGRATNRVHNGLDEHPFQHFETPD